MRGVSKLGRGVAVFKMNDAGVLTWLKKRTLQNPGSQDPGSQPPVGFSFSRLSAGPRTVEIFSSEQKFQEQKSLPPK